MLHGVHARLRRGGHNGASVGVGHDGHPRLMGNVHQGTDGLPVQPVLRQHTEPVKVHETGNHDLHKIRSPGFLPGNQGRILPQGAVDFPDKRPVVPPGAKGGKGRAVKDSVFRGQ